MKKNGRVVLRETFYISVGVIILSLFTQAIFLIIGEWDYTVLLGNLLSGAVAVLNFYLMGLTVERAVEKENKEAANFMRLSQTLRLMMIFISLAVGIAAPCFNIVTVILPVFFPRIIIMFRPLFDKKNNDSADE